MTFWTSYFGNLKNIPDNYLRVSISRFTPKFFTNAWNQVTCKKCILAPSEELLHEYKEGNLTDEDYTIIYLKELKSNLQNVGYQSLKDYLVALINFYSKEGFHDNCDRPVKFDNKYSNILNDNDAALNALKIIYNNFYIASKGFTVNEGKGEKQRKSTKES